jgi:hypothetical protein
MPNPQRAYINFRDRGCARVRCARGRGQRSSATSGPLVVAVRSAHNRRDATHHRCTGLAHCGGCRVGGWATAATLFGDRHGSGEDSVDAGNVTWAGARLHSVLRHRSRLLPGERKAVPCTGRALLSRRQAESPPLVRRRYWIHHEQTCTAGNGNHLLLAPIVRSCGCHQDR